jgi:hypothetical protein
VNGFHGNGKRRSYFEGWYLKQQNRDASFALIVSFQADERGRRCASIQTVLSDGAYQYSFPAEAFSAERERFHIRIGENLFREDGILLNLRSPDISGRLCYGPFSAPDTDIMGPFRFVPAMQCRHGVLSFAHRISGSLQIDGRTFDFNGGLGYCETDRGSSFPRRYLWTQCMWEEETPCSVMISAAHVPFLGRSFTGCIGTVFYNGKEYRFATYNGVKLIKWNETGIVLQQKEYHLQAEVLEKKEGSGLVAPVSGKMCRPVHENLACRMRYRFSEGGRQIFDVVSSLASFEYADLERAVPG